MTRFTQPIMVSSEDIVFAENLARALAESCYKLDVHLSDPNHIEDIVSRYDVFPLITDSATALSWIDNGLNAILSGKTIFVMGNPFPDAPKYVTFLNPALTAREIVAELLQSLGKTAITKMDSLNILVTSSAGGVGVSAFATSLARIIKNEKQGAVLYLSMESYPHGERFLSGTNNGRTLEEYLFRFFGSFGNVAPEAFLRETLSGVRFFSSKGNYNEFLRIGTHDLDRVLDELCTSVQRGTVVFDVPAVEAERFQPVLDRSNLLVVLSDGERTTEERNQKMIRTLEERYSFDAVMQVRNEPRPCRNATETADIPYEPESFVGGEIFLENAFGNGVKNIAGKLGGI